MQSITRRQVVVAAGALSLQAAGTVQAEDKPKVDASEQADRERVLACGMTEAEADCWGQIAKAAGSFFKLPKLHPMDDQEVAQAVHVIQNKLLGRPTYRKYLELAKGQAK